MQDAERLAQEELLARLRRGDEQALVDLADEFGTKIYQLAFRYLRNKEDAEEVTQHVLFKVYRKVDAFRGDAALSSWIYRITFNAAMSRLRTAKFQRSQDEQRLPHEPQSEGGEKTRRRPPRRGQQRKRRRANRPTGATWRTSTSCARKCGVVCSAPCWRCRSSTARRSCS